MRKNKVKKQNPFSILTVDDDLNMTSSLKNFFERAGYLVETENNPSAAIERVRNGNFDILLLDFLMTPICGDKVVEEIRSFNKEIYIILLTGHKSMAPPIKTIRELDIQGYYEKSDRFDQLELLVESCTKSILQMRTIRSYQNELNQMYQNLKDNYMEMIQAMRLLVDARNEYTRGHSDRVSAIAVEIARAMGKSEEYCERIRVAGLFHDIGKIGVPDEVLLKKARLSEEEYSVIKKHSAKGAQVLSSITAFQDIVPIVRSHHERYDGKGYPDGLRGEEIPEEGRIMAVADSYDAMTSDRQYRKGLGIDMALEELKKGKGTQFDATIVDVMIDLVEKTGRETFYR
ncbi:MAG: HD-GYP domain-containing protein, partial [Lachnospiraceae bacterium]|nr:HD-GYP domain-containing protein [Lachnospiraceae bacterium]